ncbi:carbon-nitrogen hydrolase [Physcia stellaris]|nr:carbon-nitrogen hydrolase [Physcia stellaris]
MRIACIQLASELGKIQENIRRADVLLEHLSPGQCDLLVLPELAFSGYNFPSLDAIRPFLEPTARGASATWARDTARRLDCIVTVGYPEITVGSKVDPTMPASICYNSTITVSAQGDTLAHYRKTHLYYTDETWASESDTKWLTIGLPLSLSPPSSVAQRTQDRTTQTTFGICMDLNPYQFTAPWTLYELASYSLNSSTQLLVLSMAWLTHRTSSELLESPGDPDLETLNYWVERIVPLVKNREGEVVVVFANRCGEEPIDARYAGTSWIGRVGFGKVKIWDTAGKAEEKLLLIDTDHDPEYELRTSGTGISS